MVDSRHHISEVKMSGLTLLTIVNNVGSITISACDFAAQNELSKFL